MNIIKEYMNAIIALAALALLVAGFFGVRAYNDSLREEGRAEIRAEVSKQALKQIERALDQTRLWKDHADEVNKKYTVAFASAIAADKRNADLLAGMRKRTPSAEQLASVAPAACGEYAAETDRDFAACRVEYQAVGRIAAEASAAAWALKDAWPEYDKFQDKLTTFTNSLKGNTP